MKRHYIKIYLSMACVFCRKQRTRKKHQFLWCAKTLDIQMREFGSLYHFALELTLRNFLFICIQKFKGQIHKSILRTPIIYFKECASTKMRCALLVYVQIVSFWAWGTLNSISLLRRLYFIWKVSKKHGLKTLFRSIIIVCLWVAWTTIKNLPFSRHTKWLSRCE